MIDQRLLIVRGRRLDVQPRKWILNATWGFRLWRQSHLRDVMECAVNMESIFSFKAYFWRESAYSSATSSSLWVARLVFFCFVFFSLSGRCHLVSVLMCASTSLFAESLSAGGTARERKYMKMTAFNVAAKNEVNDHDWPVFMCFPFLFPSFSSSSSSLQLDARWSMVLKMVRTHLMGPLSWGRVKWPSIMGTGVLYLLLLSTCLGQDTEGKGTLQLPLLFHSQFLSLTRLFPLSSSVCSVL